MSVLCRINHFQKYRLLAIAVCALSLLSCVSFTQKHAEYYRYLTSANHELALQELERLSHSNRDRVLYELDKAMLLRLTGDYEGSNNLLESAKRRIQKLSATSISENIAAVTINEMGRSYIGQPYEQLLLFAYKTLNYLALGDLNSARVEVLQADAKLREWVSTADWEGIEASVLMRYLSGIVFEMNQEWSEALIAYRKAYEVFQDRSTTPPEYLQNDLLRLTKQMGLENEYRQYLERFANGVSSDNLNKNGQSEIVFLLHQGLVSRLYSQIISNFSPDLNQHVRIATPVYPFQSPLIWQAELRIDGQSRKTFILQDIDKLARDNLAVRAPGIAARAMLRVVAKKTAAHNANKEDAFAGFLVDLAGILTEQADTRSWSSLPATIQIARISVPEGQHEFSATAIVGDRIDKVLKIDQTISLAANEIKVISVHDVALGVSATRTRSER